MNTKTTIIDVYKFAYSTDCPLSLRMAILEEMNKLFLLFPLAVQQEMLKFEQNNNEELNND